MKKSILFISPLPPPWGGIATWTKKIIEDGLPDGTPLALVDTKIRGNRNIFENASLSLSEISRNFHILFKLLIELIKQRPKLVHLNCSLSPAGIFRDLACALLCKLFGITIIAHYHGNLADFKGQKFLGLSYLALKSLMRLAKVNIFVNQTSVNLALNMVNTKEKAKIYALPNFIEDKFFDLKVQSKGIHKRFRAIFAGGITTSKGCLEILSIAEQLPEIDFHLFGKMHKDMAPFYLAPPKNIFLHGVTDHEILLGEMCQSDFLLFPSHTEGFPLTVLEAMAVGLPIIATSVGAIPEMVDEFKGGFLVQPRDINAFINVIQKLISDPNLILMMGKYNKEKSYTQYRYSLVIQSLLEIYECI